MSGSPVLVEVSGTWACIGMLYLGGEGAATSRFVLASSLLKMMDARGVDYASPLNARDLFRSSLVEYENVPQLSKGRTALAREPSAMTAPALPSNYLPRPDVLLPLRTACLDERTDKPISLTGLKGMGGVGKTVLARALCHDPAIQSRFPDGFSGSPLEQSHPIWLGLSALYLQTCKYLRRQPNPSKPPAHSCEQRSKGVLV
jgi:hypothetical protein